MSYTKKVAYNTIVQIASKIIVTALSLISIGYLTRYLGVANYGAYTTIFTYVSFWAVLADFGFFWVLVREVSKPGSDGPKIFNNVITLKIIFAIIVFVICSVVAFLIPQYSWTIKIGISIIAISWFWNSLNSTYVGLFQSHLEMYKSAITEIIGRVVLLFGVILLIKGGRSLQEILWVYILANFVNFYCSLLWGSSLVKFKPRFDFDLWKLILIDSFPLAILSFVGLIHFKIDTVILSLIKGNLDVGIYGVPYKILEIVVMLPTMFVGNIFPIVTKYYHGKDPRLNLSIQRSFDFLCVSAFPVVTGLIVLAWPIINLIAGQEYLTSSTVSLGLINFPAPRILMILSFTIGLTFFITIFSNLLTVIGKQYKQVIPITVATAINVILNFILIPRYSYLAAALVNCFTNTIMLIWWYRLTKKYLHFNLNYFIVVKSFGAALVMSAVLLMFKNANIVILIILGAASYIVALYLFKGISKDDFKQLLPTCAEENNV